MRYLLTIFALILAISLTSCNGSHCLSIGGQYEKINGNLQYCWDNTSNAQRPVLTNSAGDSAVLFTQEDVEKIAIQLETSDTTKMQSTSQKPFSDNVNAILKKIYK